MTKPETETVLSKHSGTSPDEVDAKAKAMVRGRAIAETLGKLAEAASALGTLVQDAIELMHPDNDEPVCKQAGSEG